MAAPRLLLLLLAAPSTTSENEEKKKLHFSHLISEIYMHQQHKFIIFIGNLEIAYYYESYDT